MVQHFELKLFKKITEWWEGKDKTNMMEVKESNDYEEYAKKNKSTI